MKTSRSWKTIAGWVLHGLVAGIMLLAGSAKVLGLFPPEQVAKLGLGVPIQVIGAGELVSAVLLLVPRTASLGVLLTSGFWGGAICLHMSKGEPFVLQSVFLLLTWVGRTSASRGRSPVLPCPRQQSGRSRTPRSPSWPDGVSVRSDQHRLERSKP